MRRKGIIKNLFEDKNITNTWWSSFVPFCSDKSSVENITNQIRNTTKEKENVWNFLNILLFLSNFKEIMFMQNKTRICFNGLDVTKPERKFV